MKKMMTLALAALLALSLPAGILAEDAAPATWTVEEMVAFGIQDEVNAEAAYRMVLDTFGADARPFSNIIRAERAHQALLAPLMAKYGVPMPQAADTAVPETFADALALGVRAEQENIAIYEGFLAQGQLPADVQAVFERLLAGSEKHLEAFSGGRGGRGAWQHQPRGGRGRR